MSWSRRQDLNLRRGGYEPPVLAGLNYFAIEYFSYSPIEETALTATGLSTQYLAVSFYIQLMAVVPFIGYRRRPTTHTKNISKWSRWRESNSRHKLGRLQLCH